MANLQKDAVDPEEATPLAPSANNAKPQASALFQASWQAGAVLCFVVLSAGQTLATRMSMGHSNELPYDTAAAVSCAEGIKLVISLCWVAKFDRRALPWPIAGGWIHESLDLLVVAVLFALQNQLNFLVVERLGAAMFVILGNLKIVFTCFFMRVMLDRHFASLQWVAVAMLTLSAFTAQSSALDVHQGSRASMLGIAFLLVSTASSGLASVKNELILKREVAGGPPMPFMVKNAVLYTWGFGLNLASWAACGRHAFFGGFDRAAVASVLCLVGLGLACSIILGYLDNVIKCFSSVLIVLVTVAASRLLPAYLHEGSFGAHCVVSLVLLSGALVLYQAHASPRLNQHLFVAMSVAAVVGGICVKADNMKLV